MYLKLAAYYLKLYNVIQYSARIFWFPKAGLEVVWSEWHLWIKFTQSGASSHEQRAFIQLKFVIFDKFGQLRKLKVIWNTDQTLQEILCTIISLKFNFFDFFECDIPTNNYFWQC